MRRPGICALGLAAAFGAQACAGFRLGGGGAAMPEAQRRRLAEAIERYQRLADEGGWAALPENPSPEDLRRRLGLTGDLSSRARREEPLARAVRRFQSRHGLPADGVVGPQTLAALNVPAEARVRQLRATARRLEEGAQAWSRRYLFVNIPDFRVSLVEGRSARLTLRAVVGLPEHPTPVMSSRVTHLVLNPAWDIPPGPALEEALAALREDPAILARRRIRVLRGGGDREREVDLSQEDCSSLSSSTFRYRLRQEPGPENPLGRVKFVFPNPRAIHLHDTPRAELFARLPRAFSLGCVRVDAAVRLAALLLRDNPGWPPDAIVSELARNRTVPLALPLPRPLEIHIVYWTAWVDDDGAVQFREDVYGWDQPREPPGQS